MSFRWVLRHKASGDRYVIPVTSDPMEPRIQHSDLILVDYSKEPRPGNIVIILINGAAVVKKYLRQKGRVILRSMNLRYADIEIKETDQFVSPASCSGSWKGHSDYQTGIIKSAHPCISRRAKLA